MEMRLNLYRLSRKGVGLLSARSPKRIEHYCLRYSQFCREMNWQSKRLGESFTLLPLSGSKKGISRLKRASVMTASPLPGLGTQTAI